MHSPVDTTSTKVEAKVKGAAMGAFAAGLGAALLNAAVANSELLGGVPAWLQFILIMLGPGLATFLSGYATKSATSRVSAGYVPPASRAA
jgi:hypothetical protein